MSEIEVAKESKRNQGNESVNTVLHEERRCSCRLWEHKGKTVHSEHGTREQEEGGPNESYCLKNRLAKES